MLLGLLGVESLMVTKHTHKMRAIQLIIKRVANMRMKIVEALATQMIGMSVVYILIEMAEWGF
jgi:hypothetical protein